MTSLLALDLGKTTGWARWDATRGLRFGSERFGANGLGERLGQLRKWLEEELGTCTGLVLEKPVIAHASAALPLHGMFATAVTVAWEQGVPTEVYYPTSVKKGFTGSGKAKKTDMIAQVKARFGVDLKPKQHDIADAIGLLTVHQEKVLQMYAS